MKLAAGVAKSIIRGIVQVTRSGDFDKYIGETIKDVSKLLNYSDLVICFDDFDRKSNSLNLQDVFGFVNSLVENQGAKILIIANEKELISDDNYNSKLREKVIGVSIQYAPDLAKIFDQIITDKYSSSSKVYYDFLVDNKLIILEIIEKNLNNFRNLIFFLEHFKTIFFHIESIFQTDSDFAIQKYEKQKSILVFSISISIEYKLGTLNSTNFPDFEIMDNDIFEGFDFTKDLIIDKSNTFKEEGSDHSIINTFKQKYYYESRYYFYKSIFEYITGIKAFDINLLKKEIETYFIIENGAIPSHEIVLQKLSYMNCFNLLDSEYRSLTTEMLNFFDKGVYQIQQIVTVFHYATRFNNLLDYDLYRLKGRFIKGIDKGKKHFTYKKGLGFIMSVDEGVEFKKEIDEIVKYCISINESLKETEKLTSIKELFELFQNDFDTFLIKVNNFSNQLQTNPFWCKFNINKVFRRIRKLENDKIWQLGNFFKERYKVHIFIELYPEKKFLEDLRTLIDNPTKVREKKTLKNTSFNYLSKCIKECENNFENKV